MTDIIKNLINACDRITNTKQVDYSDLTPGEKRQIEAAVKADGGPGVGNNARNHKVTVYKGGDYSPTEIQFSRDSSDGTTVTAYQLLCDKISGKCESTAQDQRIDPVFTDRSLWCRVQQFVNRGADKLDCPTDECMQTTEHRTNLGEPRRKIILPEIESNPARTQVSPSGPKVGTIIELK